MHCVAKNCGSKFKDNPRKLSFHSFPSDEEERGAWMSQLGLDVSIPKGSRLCSLHFAQDDFYEMKKGCKVRSFLKRGAVPRHMPMNPNAEKVKETERHQEDINIQSPLPSQSYSHETFEDNRGANTSTNMICNDDESTLDAFSDGSMMDVLYEGHPPSQQTFENTQKTSTSVTWEAAARNEEEIQKQHRKVRTLEMKNKSLTRNVQRKEQKVKELKAEVRELKSKLLKKQKSEQQDLDCLPPAIKSLVERIIQMDKCKGTRYTVPYNEALRRFSVGMDFRAPRGYRFLRSECRNALPGSRTIAKWYQNLDCDPGFTGEAFKTLEALVDRERALGRVVVCQLVFDEIHIFSQNQRVGDKQYGMAQFGDLVKKDGQPALATQLLVFMVVSVDKKWKIPIGYFPFWSMHADQKAEIISKAVLRVEETGIKVLGLTFDGAAVNLSVMKLLGVDIQKNHDILDVYKCTILDDETENNGPPPTRKYFMYPDPCHMIKLVRNTLGEYDLLDNENREINFQYVVELFELQRSGALAGLELGTKLKSNHILYDNRKMNVELAVQVLSNSVAEAIDFCRDVLRFPQFANSEGTTHFIRVMNNAFDVLNSRKDSHVGYKSPLTDSNICEIERFCQEAVEYLSELKIRKKNGTQKVINSANKMGFIGIIVCLKNLPHMYMEIKEHITGGLKTYMLNQDHIEMFFGTIRTRLGANTNPTVLQFRAAYKKILTNAQLETSLDGTNCLGTLEDVAVLEVNTSRSLDYINNNFKATNSREIFQTEEEVDQEIAESEGDSFLLDNTVELSSETQLALQLTQRQLVSRTRKRISCEGCSAYIHDPSDFFSKLTEASEIYIRNEILKDRGKFLSDFKISVMVNNILKDLKDFAYEEDLHHFLENIDHYTNLITIYVTLYADVRYRKEQELSNEKESIRNKLHCLTHFKNM